MADKRIADFATANDLQDGDLLLISSGGETKNTKARSIKNAFWNDIAEVTINTYNLFDKTDVILNKILNQRYESDASGWFISHYIPVEVGETYSIAPRSSAGVGSATETFKLRLCFYDSSYNYVSRADDATNGTPGNYTKTITTEMVNLAGGSSTTGYIRFSAEAIKLDSMMVCLQEYGDTSGYAAYQDIKVEGIKYPWVGLFSNNLALKNEILNSIGREHLTVGSSDVIAILGDSATESVFAIKDKAFISKLSQFTNYQIFNYSASGKTLKSGIFRMQNNTLMYDSEFGYQDIRPKYTLLLCYVNDIKIMTEDGFAESLKATIDAVRMYGSEPIICNHFRMEHPLNENIFASVAKEKGVAFWDIYKMIHLTQEELHSGPNYYSWYWKEGHPGTRPNAMFSDTLQYYLDKLEAPTRSLKIYRLRSTYSNSVDLDTLRFDSPLELYNKFREISVGQKGVLPEDVTPLANDKNIDNLSAIANTVQSKLIASEYDILRKANQSINIDTKCALISATLPYTDLTHLKLSFDVSSASGLKVYIRDQNAAPKVDGNIYMRFDMTDTSGITAGSTTFQTQETVIEDGETVVETVDWVVNYVIPNKCIYCYHGGWPNPPVKEADGGAGVLDIGAGKTYSLRVKSYYYDENDKLVTGHYAELSKDSDENSYTVPSNKIKSVLIYDRADFLITSNTAFDISNIDVEYEGARDKKCIRGDFVFESANGTNLIENPVFTTLNGWIAIGGAASADAEDGCYIPGTSKVVDITNTKYLTTNLTLSGGEMGKRYVVDVYARYYPPQSTVANPTITYDSLDYKRLCLQLSTIVDAESNVYDTVSTYEDFVNYDTTELQNGDIIKVPVDKSKGNRISYYAYDAAQDELKYVDSKRIHSQYQIVSTAWKICRFEIIAPPGTDTYELSILGADASPLQIAKVVCVEKIGG